MFFATSRTVDMAKLPSGRPLRNPHHAKSKVQRNSKNPDGATPTKANRNDIADFQKFNKASYAQRGKLHCVPTARFAFACIVFYQQVVPTAHCGVN